MVSSQSELVDALMSIPIDNWQRRRHYDDIIHGHTYAHINEEWIDAILDMQRQGRRIPRAWRYTPLFTRIIRSAAGEHPLHIAGPLLEEMRVAAENLRLGERERAALLQARRTGADRQRRVTYNAG
jgi:hypothetical protein